MGPVQEQAGVKLGKQGEILFLSRRETFAMQHSSCTGAEESTGFVFSCSQISLESHQATFLGCLKCLGYIHMGCSF